MKKSPVKTSESWKLGTQIKAIYEESVKKFQSLETLKILSSDADVKIRVAVEWLKEHQHPGGYWGDGAAADTGLALLVLSFESVKRGDVWKVKGGFDGGVEKTVEWLKTTQNDNWGENVWDTAIVTRALLTLGVREDWVQRALKWLETQKETAWGLKTGSGLHHVAQALNTMVVGRCDNETITHCKQVILEKIPEEHDPYVIGQVAEALIRAGENPASNTMKNLQITLEKYLDEVKISEATFQDSCISFRGLADILSDSKSMHIQKTLADIFKSPDRFKPEGCWYHDAKKTAFALYGLHALKEVRKIDEYPITLYEILSKNQKNIENALKNHDENVSTFTKNLSMLFCLIMLTVVLVASGVATYNFYAQALFSFILGGPLIYLSKKTYDLYKKIKL